jgi:hypothetical protein
MRFTKRSIAAIAVVAVLSLETLVASAATQNPNFQPQSSSSNSGSRLISSQDSPVLLARSTKRKTKKSKLRRPKKSKLRQSRPEASSSLISKYEDTYFQGRQAVYGCIVEQNRNSATKECREVVAIKSSLINWCYQDSVACTYVDRLATDEIFWGTQVTIMNPV